MTEHKPRIDRGAIARARAIGVDLEYGYQRKTDHRFLLFKMDGKFPAAHKKGSALRSRVVWWLYTGEVLRGWATNLHHKNHNRADDRFCNLERIEHAVHARKHNPAGLCKVERICMECFAVFKIDGWRLKDTHRGRFCGQQCYHAHERSSRHVAAISKGLRRAYAEGRR